MENKLRKFAILLLLGLITNSSFAQLNTPDNWSFFQSPEKVNTIFEDGNKLWFGTQHGFVILDKVTTDQKYYNAYNSNLLSENVIAIAKTGGDYYLGTSDLTLLQISNDIWTSIEIPVDEDELIGNEEPILYGMKSDSNGNLWMGTNYGAVKYDGEIFEIFNHNNTPQTGITFQDIWNIEVDEQGNIYFSSFEIYQYNGSDFINLSDGDFDLFSNEAPVITYGGGKLWFNNFSGNIAWYDTDGWHFLDTNQIPNETLLGIEIDQNGTPYFNYENGEVYTVENEEMVLTNLLEGLTEQADELFFDETNTLWASESAAFLTKINNEKVSGILGSAPFRNNTTRVFAEDNEGEVYMVNDSRHILKYIYDEGWSELFIPENIVYFSISSMAFDSQNDLWATTPNGLLHFDGVEWEILNSTTDSNIPFVNCGKLNIDEEDRKWVRIFDDKLAMHDGEVWTAFTADLIPWAGSLNALALDGNNNLWVADSDGALFQITPTGTFTQIDTEPILLNENAEIRTLNFDSTGKLWAITDFNNDFGVFNYGNSEWTEFDDGSAEYIYSGAFAEGSNGIFLGLTNGILHFTEDLDIEYISNENSLLWSYNQFFPSLFMDNHGSLWAYSNLFGLNVYNENGFIITDVKDVSNENFAATWRVYPNPASQQIKVEMLFSTPLFNERMNLNLINSVGQVLQSYSIGFNNKAAIDLNVEQLQSGIYYLQMVGLPAQKIIIQH